MNTHSYEIIDAEILEKEKFNLSVIVKDNPKTEKVLFRFKDVNSVFQEHDSTIGIEYSVEFKTQEESLDTLSLPVIAEEVLHQIFNDLLSTAINIAKLSQEETEEESEYENV